MLTDQPRAGNMLLTLVLDPLWRPIGDPHANSGKSCLQSAAGPEPPTHILPLGISKHVFRRHRQRIRNVPLTGATSAGDRKDQLDPRRINFLPSRNAGCPGQATGRETLTERRAEPVTDIRQHTAEANTGYEHEINFSQRDLRLGSRDATLDMNARKLSAEGFGLA